MLLIWISAVVSAQTPANVTDGADDIFAPYPARLRVGIRANDLIMTWEDSPDAEYGYRIYRSSGLPSPDSIADAVALGDVPAGTITFAYVPPDGKEYYYFVLARTPDDDVYRILIPLRNVTLAPIGTAIREEITLKPVPSFGSISGILARNDGDAIMISFDAIGVPGRFVLYRGTAPITDNISLLEATVAGVIDPGAPPFRDYPVPGIGYYYAVIQEQALFGGLISITAGSNATVNPVAVPAGTYRVGLPVLSPSARSIPLPYLVLSRGFQDSTKAIITESPAPSPRVLSVEAEKAVAWMLREFSTRLVVLRPVLTIFPEDLRSPGGGEEYTLRMIVSEFLVKGLYKEAAERFTLYLSLPRSILNAARARFYRGQALVLSGSLREAFFDLLQVQQHYYLESTQWIDYIFYRMRNNG
jgi:hypothetical protein